MITRLRIRNFRVFSQFEIEPRPGLNILVGENESGKSTILQALTLALTGRWDGHWARDSLTPDWFHRRTADMFFDLHANGKNPELPEIELERVLIVPPSPIEQFVVGGESLTHRSACGFYVGVTRAKHSVALALSANQARAAGLPLWKP